MILFVDKLEPMDLGGSTTDLAKIRYALKKHKLIIEDIIENAPQHVSWPTGVFHAGKYIVIFNFNRDFTTGNLAFINHTVDLQKNFNAFADCLTPKTLGAFNKMQEIVKRKSSEALSSVVLSDGPLFINELFSN